jgi:hypothetical protein
MDFFSIVYSFHHIHRQLQLYIPRMARVCLRRPPTQPPAANGQTQPGLTAQASPQVPITGGAGGAGHQHINAAAPVAQEGQPLAAGSREAGHGGDGAQWEPGEQDTNKRARVM